MPEVRTRALVLHRTNYGEADRILTMLTENGKISALAKSVRKEKSKLAGAIEMFSISTITYHERADKKDDLKILTSAKLETFYKNLLTDFNRLNLATEILKLVNKFSEHVDSPEFFKLTEQALRALNEGQDMGLVELWTKLNLAKISGEELNFIRDNSGQPLDSEKTYSWNSLDQALEENPHGQISINEIKFLRLLVSANLQTCLKVKNFTDFLPHIYGII